MNHQAAQVFVTQPCSPGASVELDEDDSHHLARVLRARAGEPIVVVGARVAWDAVLDDVRPKHVTATIVKTREPAQRELPVAVSVLQSIPKGAKMDTIVEKVTELGASRIIPIWSERSLRSRAEHKLERWQKIARAAAAQSRRLIIPTVEAPENFSEAVSRFASQGDVLVAWERADAGSLAAALARAKPDRSIAIAIGPEGSFTDREIDTAKKLRCDIVSLGARTLRTETAGPAALAAVAALRGWW